MSVASIGVDPDRPSLLTLYLDGLPSSALDLTDPEHLEFEYMQHMRIMVEAKRPRGTRIKALHIGGAGCALPRALDSSHPNSRQLAIEVDEILATKVREWFPLPRSPLLRIRAAEGRQTLQQQAGRRYGNITLGASMTPWRDMHREVFRLPLPARIYSDLTPSAAPFHDLPEDFTPTH